jgi:hypothetical protein
VNRFFDVEGDVSTQLAPWQLRELGRAGTALFRLEVPLRFRSDVAGGVIVVPAGLLSDLASIPRVAWNVMPPDDPRIALGAWVHDLLYQNEGIVTLEDGRVVTLTREQADQVLAHEAMPELGANAAEREVVYAALRCFGFRWASESQPQPEGEPA